MRILFGNLLSLIAALFTFLSAWSRDRKSIYLFQAAQCGILSAANVFFSSVSGVTTCALCTLRNLLIAYDRYTPRLCALFLAAVAALGLWANNRGLVGLLPVAATALYTVGCLYAKSPRTIKLNLIVNLILWAVYDAFVLDLISCAVDGFSALTAVYTLLREKKHREFS